MPVVVAIPVKPFDQAKARLAGSLAPEVRRRLSIELASRTVDIAAISGGSPLVLSADDEVTNWADSHDIPVLQDDGSTLDEAATDAVAWATERRMGWVVCHADLPLLTPADLCPIVSRVGMGGSAIAPSTDGGTPILGALTPSFRFAYGVGSFHRHLARLSRLNVRVFVGAGVSLDLDQPSDLEAASTHPRGRWLQRLLEAS